MKTLTVGQLIAQLSQHEPTKNVAAMFSLDSEGNVSEVAGIAGVDSYLHADVINIWISRNQDQEQDEHLPSCEECGRTVHDDMTAAFAPYCSQVCQDKADTSV